jgi:hypothetical protein
MRRTLLFTTAALVLLTAPVQASWYCPAYGTYYPNVSICPNWIPDPYGPQERQADQAAAMARRAAVERTAARLAAEAARQQAATDAAKVRAQVSAENSPNNLCRDPETAGMLMNEFNGMDWSEPRKAIDIEHLVTISGEPLACHGIWVLTHGAPIEGTMSFRKNVADNTIVSFHPGT